MGSNNAAIDYTDPTGPGFPRFGCISADNDELLPVTPADQLRRISLTAALIPLCNNFGLTHLADGNVEVPWNLLHHSTLKSSMGGTRSVKFTPELHANYLLREWNNHVDLNDENIIASIPSFVAATTAIKEDIRITVRKYLQLWIFQQFKKVCSHIQIGDIQHVTHYKNALDFVGHSIKAYFVMRAVMIDIKFSFSCSRNKNVLIGFFMAHRKMVIIERPTHTLPGIMNFTGRFISSQLDDLSSRFFTRYGHDALSGGCKWETNFNKGRNKRRSTIPPIHFPLLNNFHHLSGGRNNIHNPAVSHGASLPAIPGSFRSLHDDGRNNDANPLTGRFTYPRTNGMIYESHINSATNNMQQYPPRNYIPNNNGNPNSTTPPTVKEPTTAGSNTVIAEANIPFNPTGPIDSSLSTDAVTNANPTAVVVTASAPTEVVPVVTAPGGIDETVDADKVATPTLSPGTSSVAKTPPVSTKNVPLATPESSLITEAVTNANPTAVPVTATVQTEVASLATPGNRIDEMVEADKVATTKSVTPPSICLSDPPPKKKRTFNKSYKGAFPIPPKKTPIVSYCSNQDNHPDWICNYSDLKLKGKADLVYYGITGRSHQHSLVPGICGNPGDRCLLPNKEASVASFMQTKVPSLHVCEYCIAFANPTEEQSEYTPPFFLCHNCHADVILDSHPNLKPPVKTRGGSRRRCS
jgi:hypothetical protein